MRCGLFCLKTGLSVPLKKIDVTLSIGATVGHVESVLLYLNEAKEAIEAIFTFPLDEQSAVYKFEAEIEGRVIVAECQEKQQARETYDDAIQSGHTAFLLEESDETSDVFQCRLGNLPPGGQAKLTMSYVSELPHEVDGRIRFTLPNVLNPRYGTSTLPTASPNVFVQDSTGPDTVCINYGQYEMSFVADIQSQCRIQSVVSESDNINVVYSNENRRAQVKLTETFKPDHDLSLFVLYEDVNQPQAITERGSSQASGLMKMDVLMLSFYPDIADIKGNTTEQGEYLFVIDRSGSMAGAKMESAKDTLLLFLKSLPVGCYFNIISFGNYYHMLFDSGLGGSPTVSNSCEYSQVSLQRAIQLQQTMQADMGGTEILRPLEEIYKKPPVPGHPRQIILITDGEVWNVRNVIQLVGSNAGNTRVFAVGIGEGASTALVKGIARAGKGKYEMVKGTERLQQKVISILKCAMQPTVTNLKVSWELPPLVSAVTVPQETPNVFSGERLILYALIQGAENEEEISGTVKIGGQVEDKSFEHCLEFIASGHPSMADTSAPIHRLAAKSQIKELEDKELIEEFRGNKSLGLPFVSQKQKIILVSTGANIVSKYTSFVGVDRESKVRVKLEQPKLPEGMFGCSYAPVPGSGSLFSGGGSNLFAARNPPGVAMFGSKSIPSGGGGLGFTFGSTASSNFSPQSQSTGFPFSMRTNTGFAAATPVATGFAACAQSSSGSFGSSNPFGSSTNPYQSSGFSAPANQSLMGGFASTNLFGGQTAGFSAPANQSSGGGFGPSNLFGSHTLGAQGSNFSGFVQEQPKPQQPQGMMGLIFLQKFEGSWDLTEDFANVIGSSLAVLTQYSNTGNLSVWATCLAIAWLEKYHSTHKEEWEMIERKALTWLSKQNVAGSTLDSVLAAAQSCLP